MNETTEINLIDAPLHNNPTMPQSFRNAAPKQGLPIVNQRISIARTHSVLHNGLFST